MNSKGLLAYQMGGVFMWEQILEPTQSVLIGDPSNDDLYEA